MIREGRTEHERRASGQGKHPHPHSHQPNQSRTPSQQRLEASLERKAKGANGNLTPGTPSSALPCQAPGRLTRYLPPRKPTQTIPQGPRCLRRMGRRYLTAGRAPAVVGPDGNPLPVRGYATLVISLAAVEFRHRFLVIEGAPPMLRCRCSSWGTTSWKLIGSSVIGPASTTRSTPATTASYTQPLDSARGDEPQGRWRGDKGSGRGCIDAVQGRARAARLLRSFF